MELRKKLTGKVANVAPQITEYTEGVSGNGSSVDLETMFQLIYLRMTEPRADKTIFNIVKAQSKQMIENRSSNPATVFNDTFNRLLYSDHPRQQPPTLEMLDNMDLDKSFAFYKDRFSDAGDFTFIFVGSMDLEKMKPLVETYLGALPNTGREEKWKDLGIRTNPGGIIKETVRAGKEPKSSTRIAFTGDFNGIYDIEKREHLRVTAPLLQNRLHDVIRESMGGTYNISVNCNLIWLPVGCYIITIDFSSDPERVDELTDAIFSEIRSFKESGPAESELADVKEAFLRTNETNLTQNAYWLTRLNSCYFAGVHPDASQILLYADAVKTIDADKTRDNFQRYYDFENYIQVTLMPEESPQ